ncbi:hypothetical protein B0H19DRAFT_906494, partial [Mycena capillaripes]
QDQLLAFIDGLNVAMTASPPLRVLNFAGNPYHWAMIAGAVMQTVAGAGMYLLSHTLTDRYLLAANIRLFKPKGLAVRLCTTAAMQHIVMKTGSGSGPSTLKKIGRGVGTVLLYTPLPYTSRIVRRIADKSPKKMPLSTQRRLAALEGHALPLYLDVPPPAQMQGVMDRMSAWGVALDSRRKEKKQNKTERRRRKLARIEEQLQRLGLDPHRGSSQVAYAGPKRAEDGPGLMDGLIGPKESKLERRVADADLLEHWESDKVLWVVIMTEEMGQCIF